VGRYTWRAGRWSEVKQQLMILDTGTDRPGQTETDTGP